MSNIVLSKSVRTNLVALQSTAELISSTQNRLATGKRVNSALDNPVNFFQSSSLNNRANDLSGLLDSISNGVKTLEAADKGIQAITKLIESAKATAQQALDSSKTVASVTGDVSSLTTSTALSTLAIDDGDVITIGDGSDTLTFTVTTASSTDVGDLIDAVNAQTTVGVRASLTSDGKLAFEATGATSIVIGGTVDTAELAALGHDAGTTAAGTTSSGRSTYASQFNTIRTQIDQLARDSGYNGVNLLNGGALKVVFNELTGANQSSLAISGVTYNSAGLSINSATGTGATDHQSFQTDYDIGKAIDSLNTALTTLRTQSSTFGSNLQVVQNRQDFTKNLVSTLKSGADNLVLADTNEEGANLLALQTRQQLSQTALSLASQADQSVLRLFG